MADSRRKLTLAAAAAGRKKALPQDWRSRPDGLAKYTAARAEAQRQCNADGFDRGIEWNDFMKEVRLFMLPSKHCRFGHETLCEVVMTERQNAQPGHGSQATRPPSLVGPDFHGLPFDAQKNRQLAFDWHVAHPQFDADFTWGRPRSAMGAAFDQAHAALKAELAQPFYKS